MKKKRIRIYSSLTALTFLCASAFCACINTDTSVAAKTDQSRFYFHGAEKAAANKRTNFYIDTNNNLWAWDSVYPETPYIYDAFLPPTEPERIMKNIKEVVPTGMYNDLFYVLDTDNSLWELPTDMNPSIPKKNCWMMWQCQIWSMPSLPMVTYMSGICKPDIFQEWLG